MVLFHFKLSEIFPVPSCLFIHLEDMEQSGMQINTTHNTMHLNSSVELKVIHAVLFLLEDSTIGLFYEA